MLWYAWNYAVRGSCGFEDAYHVLLTTPCRELTNQITPLSRVIPEKLPVLYLVKIFPAFYKNRRFITTFTTARHLPLSSARSIQFMSNPIFKKFFLITSSHLYLGLSNSLLHWSYPQKPCMHLFSPHTCYMPRLSPFPWFDYPNHICWGVQSIKLLVTKLFPLSCLLALLGQNSLLSTFFSTTLSLPKRRINIS
jgi:hypothetical protein